MVRVPARYYTGACTCRKVFFFSFEQRGWGYDIAIVPSSTLFYFKLMKEGGTPSLCIN